MELELRDKDGGFIFSVYGEFSEIMLKFLAKEATITIEDYVNKSNGNKYRDFINRTNETIGGKNDFIQFHIKPGQYFKLLK